MPANLTDQAIKLLVERRWPMLPSTGSSKGPCVAWKEFQERLPTPEQLREWGRRFTVKRWGLVTGTLSGVMVLDFDGAAGLKLLRKWGIKPHLKTGSGGFHWYLRHPGWRVPTLNAKTSKASWPWPGLDVRGDGGFAVLLGRNDNGPYEELRELVPDAFDDAPEEVRIFLRNQSAKADTPPKPVRNQQPSGGSGRVDTERLIGDALQIVSKRGRNDAGIWLACQLRDNGYSQGEAETAMRNYQSSTPSTNAKGQREPYSVAEALASLRQAYSRPAREKWAQRTTTRKGAPTPAPSGREAQPSAADRKQNTPQDADADGSENLYLYVGHTGEPLVGHMGEPLSSEQFSRVPRDVSTDRRLKQRDKTVYSVLACHCWVGNIVKMGKRLIAKLACCAERKVIESLRALEEAGHIRKWQGRRRGQRGQYELVCPIFGRDQRAGVQKTAATPEGNLRLISVRKDQRIAWTSHSVLSKSSNQKKKRS
jgi:Bifunctional DNA primase/polymerase, N-terminal